MIIPSCFNVGTASDVILAINLIDYFVNAAYFPNIAA